jgi:hypothetical protein
MGALDIIFHKGWEDMKPHEKAVVYGAGVLSGLVLLLTIIYLFQGITTPHSQDTTLHLDLSGIPNTSRFVDTEIINGTGRNLTLVHAPNPPNSLQLFENGQRLTMGEENDYTLSGTSIVLSFDRDPWDQFVATYRW